MMRQEYIAGLEEIRKQTIKIGQAFAAVDLTDATGMERDRRKKTAKLVGDLADSLYEDIAISAKVAADNAEAGQGEQDDLFAAADRESKAAKPEAEMPRELQPVTKTAISNAKDVLRALFLPISSEENLPNETVPADRFQTVYTTLSDLVSRLEQEGLK